MQTRSKWREKYSCDTEIQWHIWENVKLIDYRAKYKCVDSYSKMNLNFTLYHGT